MSDPKVTREHREAAFRLLDQLKCWHPAVVSYHGEQHAEEDRNRVALAAAYQAGRESAGEPWEVLAKVLDWLNARGESYAATDLDCNWNDPGNPGDGSCRTIREKLGLLKGGE